MNKHGINRYPKQTVLRLVIFAAVFALVAVFGLSFITGNDRQSNIGVSSASAQEPADINNDNKVDVFDLSILLSKWNTTDTTSDLNSDGSVNIFDLSMLLSRWGVVAVSPGMDAGAQLPITYDIASLSGTKRYVASNGNDTTGTGTISAPYATLTKAESMSADGDKIIVRGGTYPIAQRTITYIDRSIAIMAYPGEVPVFDGSIAAPTSVSTEGSLRYFSYQPIPAVSGNGLNILNLPTATFSGTTPTGLAAERGWRCATGTNTYTAPATPTGCTSPKVITGFYPDQVWVDGEQLIQVADKALVGPGKFYVARDAATDLNPTVTNLYMHQNDAADMSKVRVSYSGGAIANGTTQGDFIRINTQNVRIEGIKVFGHSPAWDSMTFRIMAAADSTVLKNIEIDSSTAVGIGIAGTKTNFISDVTLDRTTILRTGWMGVSPLFSDRLTVQSAKINYSNPHKEIGAGPSSGAIKFSKVRDTKVLGSEMSYNNAHALWFDQSCLNTIIANSRFVDNSHSGVFYEISHNLTMVNNYLKSNSPDTVYLLRLAASSGIRLVNNTVVGGVNSPVSLHADGRTKKYDSDGDGTPDRYCAEHILRYGGSDVPPYDVACINGNDSSELQTGLTGRYGATNQTLGLNFQPSIDMMVNNVISSNSTVTCGLLCVLGYTHWKSGNDWVDASVMMDSMFHRARTQTIEDPAVAATLMDGNVYQIASGNIAKFSGGFTDINVGTGANFVAVDQRPGSAFTVTSIAALRSALGASPYNLVVEAAGKSATTGLVDALGAPTASLNHADAVPVPTDTIINQYIPAGTKWYGILNE